MEISRRRFLQVIVVTAGTLEACSSDIDQPPPSVPEDNSRFFPQSIASGDPRPESVVLWTRLEDDEDLAADRRLSVEVALDPFFTVMIASKADLPVTASHDHNVKVKVTGLRASTYYYYRFTYEKNGKKLHSRIGRTKTAPAANDERKIKFVVGTCQDFIGRFYNPWQRLLALPDEDIDFVIYLGDYVYETTGDPGYMSPSGARNVVFREPETAIALGTADAPFYAAQSLSNYRDLYRTIRSDRFLQAVHEKYPFVFVWDDHEYADDCHGATSTYTSGIKDETNVDRRRNAELVFFEFIPLDHPGVTADVVDFDALATYPDTRIYRDFTMGKHMRLAVADHRTYRPDHLIPEDAYPATVVMDAATLAAAGLASAFSSDAFAYVDIDDAVYRSQKATLTLAYLQLATTAGLDSAAISARVPTVIKGLLALAYVNAVLGAVGSPPIDPSDKPRGMAWVHMGKRDLFNRQGSRYVVVKDTLDAYAAYEYAATQGASENVLGDAQQAWLDETLAGPETWKVLVSSVSMTSMMIDARNKPDITDPTLQNRFYLNVDQWDGFPNRRMKLLDQLSKVSGGKALVLSGDIHAAFASVESGVACLTTPAISSQTIKGGAAGVVVGAGFDPNSAVYKYAVLQIESTFQEANPGIAFSDCDSHGFLVVELGAEEAIATFHLIAGTNAETDYGTRPADLPAKFAQRKFRVASGSIVPA
ncbi:MAG TPA: alkaline phosphatase D family protein [Polyangiaceae bacterium]|nr:alkaline phosphatase D family protein [Polyangiaceae bacterium]